MKQQTKTRKDALQRLEIPKRKLPKAWTQAAGLLKNKPIDGLAYQKSIRREWDGYLTRQIRLARGAR